MQVHVAFSEISKGKQAHMANIVDQLTRLEHHQATVESLGISSRKCSHSRLRMVFSVGRCMGSV